MEIPDKLRDFVNEERQPRPAVTHPDDALQLDSHNLMRLVAFLETDFGFVVPDEELIPENFENLRAIEQMLAGKGRRMYED